MVTSRWTSASRNNRAIGNQSWRAIGEARVGHFATSLDDRPAIVPVCFVLVGETVYHVIDRKPKSVPAEQLRRVRNLQANPRAALLVDHYEEEWDRLWFVLLEGPVRMLREGPEHDRAIEGLRAKYLQYREMDLEPDALVIALDIEKGTRWPR